MVDIKKEIHNELTAIYNEFYDLNETKTIVRRGFTVSDYLKENSILFLGMNPAYNAKEDKDRFDNICYGDAHNIADKVTYFKAFNSLIGKEWNHLDILFFRETNQNEVKNFMQTKVGATFLYKQICLSKKLIELSKPKVIIASNALVRTFLGFHKNIDTNEGVWMGFNFKFDNEIGTYRIKSQGNLFDTPIFFTSMLSGQRALDLGSFERLKWHIKFVLEKITKLKN